MQRLIYFVVLCLAPLSHILGEDFSLLTSRFILTEDPFQTEVAGVPLRSTWWSRPYEYAFAAEFADPDCVVLDAACGISHPFKWLLAENCKEMWACDIDSRIIDHHKFLLETYDDLGETACLAAERGLHMSNAHLFLSSICDLPDTLPQFDRIFCISTLEHLDPIYQQQALYEFSRKLAPEGLVILTVDYPVIKPEELLRKAEKAGLVPAGDTQLNLPLDKALQGLGFCIFRCVLKHRI